MNNTIQTVFLGIIAIMLAVLIYVVYGQGLKIASLEAEKVVVVAQKEPSKELNQEELAKLSSAEVAKSNKGIQQSIIDANKSITGEIKSITENMLLVEAVVTNIANIEQVDFSKPSNVGFIKKTYQVTVAPETIFTKEKLAQLKVGDIIAVTSDVSVLMVDKFTAKEISLFNLGVKK
ncbi:MAG: hypothetical protein WAZ40_00880 [Minisyncoccia bacterium]